MKRCPNCGEELDDVLAELGLCEFCGEQFVAGEALEEDENYCEEGEE